MTYLDDFYHLERLLMGLPGSSVVKNMPANTVQETQI